MRQILSIALLALLIGGMARAQETTPAADGELERVAFRLGGYGGFASNRHTTQASIFTGGGECGAFEGGTGFGPVFGALGQFPIVEQWIDLTASAMFAQRGGDFAAAYTSSMPVLDPNTDTYVPLERKHAYTANLGYLLAEFGLRIAPIPEIPIYVRAAASVGIPLGPSHRQTEEILSPSGVLYPETNTTEREVSSGPIPEVEMPASVVGALGYMIPLNDRLSVSPEVSYYYPINNVTPHYEWKVASIQAGVAVTWSFGPVRLAPEPEPEPPIVEDIPRATPELGVTNPRELNIVRTVVTETFPILPYVFFDSAGTTIPPRYQTVGSEQASSFEETALPRRSLGAYYSILNIVGKRMRENGGTRITLNGTTDGREETVPGTANNLARARAQEVKDYLVKNWEIDPSRIRVTTSPTPTYPSSTLYTEGYQENRRVEIATSNDEVLRPIIYERLNEHSADPTWIEFQTGSGGDDRVRGWDMTVMAGERLVWSSGGEGAPPSTIKWDLDQDQLAQVAETRSNSEPLECLLALRDASGETIGSTRFLLPTNVVRQPFEVSRLSLVVFDFDRADINEQNRRMVSSFVARSMTPASTSSITGSTDRLGEFAHNQRLSEERAVAVRDLILAERPDAKITSTAGIGPSRLPYNNDVPEGRYYCRTVTVEMKTPLEMASP